MGLDTAAIIAIALAATSTLADLLRIPRKLRGWVAMALIVLLTVGNDWIFSDSTFVWRDSLLKGLSCALVTIGLYSTTKNTREQIAQALLQKNGNANGTSATAHGTAATGDGTTTAGKSKSPDDNNPYV